MLDTVIPLAFLSAACAFDFKARRIPNEITYPAFLSGMAYSAFSGGFPCLKESFFAAVSVFLLLIFVSGAFRLGGGDIKLMAGCGAWLGMQTPYFIFLALLFILAYNLSSAVKKSPEGLILALKAEILGAERQAFEGMPGAFFIAAAFIASKVLFGRWL